MVGWRNGDQGASMSVHKILTAANFPSPTSLFLPARIAHKGIRSHGVTSGGVTKAKKPRKPTHLRARLLTAYASRPANTSVVGLSVQRSKDTQSQAEIDEILPWVCFLF